LSGGLLAIAKLQGNLYVSGSYSKDLTEAQTVSQWKIEELRKSLYDNIASSNDTTTLSNTSFTRTWTVTNNTQYKDIVLVTTWVDQNGKSQQAEFFTRIGKLNQLGSLDMLYLPKEVTVTPYPTLPPNTTPAPSDGNQTPAPTAIPTATPSSFTGGDSFSFGNYSVRALVLGDGSGRSIKCTLEGFDAQGASIKANTSTLLLGSCSQTTDVDASNNFVIDYSCELTRRDTTVTRLKAGCSLFSSYGEVVSSACGTINLANTQLNQSIQFDFELSSNGENQGLNDCTGTTPTPAPTSTPVGTTPTPVPTSTPVGTTPTPVPTSTPVGITPTPAPTSTPGPTSTPNLCTVQGWSSSSVKYTRNETVSYLGKVYKSLQTHSSQPNWDPINVPALWAYVRVCP
jgi:hypothetical protein